MRKTYLLKDCIHAITLFFFIVSASQSAFACPAPEAWLKMTPSAESQHSLWIQPDDAAYQQGQRFGADIMVCADEKSVLVDKISIDAIMPAHRHGMNYLPELSQKEGTATLRASGLFFHMPGEWQITVTLEESGKLERYTLSLIAK